MPREPAQNPPGSETRRSAWLGLGWAGLLVAALAGALWAGFKTQEWHDARAFRAEAELLNREIVQGMQAYAQAIKDLRSRLPEGGEVDRAAWTRAASAWKEGAFLPGLVKVQYVQRVPRAERGAFDRVLAAEVGPGVRLWGLQGGPKGELRDQAEYFPIRHMDPPNAAAAGFDISSREGFEAEVYRPVLAQGQPVLGRRVRLVEDPYRVLVGLTLAHFRPDRPLDSIDQRREALRGYVCGMVRTPDCFEHLRKAGHPALLLDVYEGGKADPERAVYAEDPHPASAEARHQADMDLRVLGLEWHMTVRATREWRAPDRPLPWLWIWLAAWGGLVWIALRRVKVAVV